MSTLLETGALLRPHLIDPLFEDPEQDGRRRAAVAVVLREAEAHPGRVELLLIKRAENPCDHWSGDMAFPGGRWEPGDESLAATALRETFEEVGIELALDRIIGRLPRLSPQSQLLPRIDITPYVVLAGAGIVVRPNHEVADHFWVPVEDLRGPGPTATFNLTLGGEQRAWPAYVYRGHLIWGLTERIVTDLFSLLPESKET